MLRHTEAASRPLVPLALVAALVGGHAGLSAQAPATPGRIAFASHRDGNWDIFVMNADGSDPVNLTRSPDAEGEPAFSPDGSRIAFVYGWDQAPPGAVHVGAGIAIMNADGSGRQVLTQPPVTVPGVMRIPDWMEERERQAQAQSGSGMVVVSGHTPPTAAGPDAGPAAPVGGGAPAWSPDGRHLAFVGRVQGKWAPEAVRLWVINDDGSAPHDLTGQRFCSVETPAWSPDGRLIAFIGDSDPVPGVGLPQRRGLYVVSPEGTGLTALGALDPASGHRPRWFDQGRALICSGLVGVHMAMPEPGLLCLPLSGAGAQNMPLWAPDSPFRPRGVIACADWSPDYGLVFESSAPGGAGCGLYVYAGADAEPRDLSSHPAADMWPSWGPGAARTGPCLVVSADRYAVLRGEALLFRGHLTDAAGRPMAGVQIGVDDPVAQVCGIAGEPTDGDGAFTFTVPTVGTRPALYAFVFYSAPAPEQVLVVHVGEPGATIGNLPTIQVPLGNLGTVADSLEALPATATTVRTTDGRMSPASTTSTMVSYAQGELGPAQITFWNRWYDEFAGNPLNDIAAGVTAVACLAPELVASKVTCAAGVEYLVIEGAKAGLIAAAKTLIEDSDLSPDDKAVALEVLDAQDAVVSFATLDASSGLLGILDAQSAAWDVKEAVMGLVEPEGAAPGDRPALNMAVPLRDGSQVVNIVVVPPSSTTPSARPDRPPQP